MRNRNGKKRVFSGIQPSGKLHIGNYVGALSLWVELQDLYENIFCVVDLHALTMPETIHPTRLHAKSREVAALYVACGIDPIWNAIFIQSHVHEHAELAWILNCVTYESLTNDDRNSIEAKFAGKGYNFLKKEVIEVVLATIQPVQARYEEIMHELDYIDTILRQGADRVRPLAGQTMEEVRRVTGVG
jgi:tryptophanyl-tRNA synthetase